MAIKAIVAKLDDVPEALREHFTERDGKFYLTVDAVDGYALEDVNGLKTALSTERSQRNALEATVIKFKDIDPDKARTALAELETLKAIDPTKEADKIANTKFESAKAQLLEKHGVELKAKEERIGFLYTSVDGLLREQRATAALAAAKGSVELLLPHVLNSTRMVEKDGKFTTEVVDKNGVVQLDGKGNPITIDDLVTNMKNSDTFARAFEGEGQSGGGKQEDGAGSGGGGAKRGDMGGTREERVKAIAANLKVPVN